MAEWIVEIVDGTPHIKQMIPLVRCKDCKYCQERNDDGIYWVCVLRGATDADGFCYLGEKVTE